jgi:hypothetical protein
MKLFPESQKWVCTILIDPTSYEVNLKLLKKINEFIKIRIEVNGLDSWTLDEFIDLLNGILSSNPVEKEETKLFYKEIFNPSITGYIGLPYINNWDLAGLFLIMKKILEENLTTCENPEDYISNALIILKPVSSIIHDNPDEKGTQYEEWYEFLSQNFTTMDIQNDNLLEDYLHFITWGNLNEYGEPKITPTDILSNYKYGFLVLNEKFKILCYENIDSEKGFELIPDELKNDTRFLRKLLKNNGKTLKFLSNDYKSNKEFVLIAVSNQGAAINFATEELQNDREFIIECLLARPIYTWCNPLEFIPDKLKGDRQFLIEVVSKNGLLLEYVDPNLKGNLKIVLAAVKNNGLALQFISEELKSDEEIVFEAAVQNGLALKFAAEELKNNKEFMKRINNI